MATFEQYEKKDGTKLWRFNTYLGIDLVTGKQKRTTRSGFTTKKAAKLALDRLKVDFHEKGFRQQKHYTFNEIYEVWLVSYRETVKESTLKHTLELFSNRILPKFGTLRIDKIDVLYCQKAVNEWGKQLVNASTVKNYVGAVMALAVRLDYIPYNPVDRVTMPRRKRTVKRRSENFYDREQLQQFLSYLDAGNNEMAKIYFRVLAYTGMRKGELIALTYNDIDFKQSTISVNKTRAEGLKEFSIIQTPKSEKSTRLIDVDSDTMQRLKQWQLKQRMFLLSIGVNAKQKEQLVFPNLKNKLLAPCAPAQWLNTVYRQHPSLKRITVHGFRHTHASLLLEAGVPIKQVQMRLGHADIQTTLNIYAHVSKASQKEAVSKLSQYLKLG